MIEIFKKEVKQFFVSPMGYIIIAVYVFVSSLYFCTLNLTGFLVELSYDFAFQADWILMFMIPMLTMRMLADERKTKTDQLLLTSPVSVAEIVIGKYLAAMLLFLICLTVNVVFFVVVSTHSATVLWGEFLCNMIGMILLGGALISIDLFMSSLTESQLIAAFTAIGVNILMLITRSYVSTIKSGIVQFLVSLISVFKRFYESFSLGVFSISDFVYYLSFTLLFIFLTTQMIEKRRWS